MNQSIRQSGHAGGVIRTIGWASTLVLAPAVGLQVYRRRRAQRGYCGALSWPETLVFAGALGQVVYGLAARNRAFAASGSCLAVGQVLGLAAAWRQGQAARPSRRAAISRNSHDSNGHARHAAAPRDATMRGNAIMTPRNHDEHEEQRRSDSSPDRSSTTGDSGLAADPEIVETNDPVISSGPAYRSGWKTHPDSTMVIGRTQRGQN